MRDPELNQWDAAIEGFELLLCEVGRLVAACELASPPVRAALDRAVGQLLPTLREQRAYLADRIARAKVAGQTPRGLRIDDVAYVMRWLEHRDDRLEVVLAALEEYRS